MAIFTGAETTVGSIIYVLLIVFMYTLIQKLKKKSKKERSKVGKKENKEILPLGFFLGVANMVIFFVALSYTKLVM